MNHAGLTFVEHDCGIHATMHRCELAQNVTATIFIFRPGRWAVLLSVMFGEVQVQPNIHRDDLDAAWSEAIAQLHIVSPLAAALWDEALANAQGAT